jgi:hypothetical protein
MWSPFPFRGSRIWSASPAAAAATDACVPAAAATVCCCCCCPCSPCTGGALTCTSPRGTSLRVWRCDWKRVLQGAGVSQRRLRGLNHAGTRAPLPSPLAPPSASSTGAIVPVRYQLSCTVGAAEGGGRVCRVCSLCAPATGSQWKAPHSPPRRRGATRAFVAAGAAQRPALRGDESGSHLQVSRIESENAFARSALGSGHHARHRHNINCAPYNHSPGF